MQNTSTESKTRKPLGREHLYPVLPLRDIVIFPGMIVPLFIGRQKSVNALNEVARKDKQILLVTQKDSSHDNPSPEDIYRMGVLANILQMLRLPDGTVKVLVEAEVRAEIQYYISNNKFLEAEAEVIANEQVQSAEKEAIQRAIISSFEQYVKLSRKIPPEIIDSLRQVEDTGRLADAIASQISLKISEKQELLEFQNVMRRMEKLYGMIEREIELLSTENKIRSRVRDQIDKNQKEYYLNEQMKAIQKELKGGHSSADSNSPAFAEEGKDEIAELEKKIAETKLTAEAKEKALAELKKLRNMSPMSAEATVIRNYLDWLLDIPWKKRSKIKQDIDLAEKTLDDDHYGLEKVKERVIEYLAVQQRTKSMKGQILCFVGPPGVGKTSLANSIAKATGRNFARISLGGVRDESEIRGHRRTYIGSMPGKIIQSMKKAKTSNPLLLLDEVDKMGNDHRGDPASALLEVLDPEQNPAFNDHYLEVDYDLSDVMFITTANTTNMPRPLLDRMEIIRLSGYTEEEKIQISRRHLIPKQLEKHGLKPEEWSISDNALHKLIQHYTRESGVRNLEREIAKLARKAVTEIVRGKRKNVQLTESNLRKYSGVERHDYNIVDKDNHIGVTTGLAYTEVGGDLLPIEAVLIPGGKGKPTLTGKLGEVMQESAQAAWSYVRSRSHEFGISHDQYQKNDIHIHVPEGATPKDGPSAGAAICTSIVSALTGIPVSKDIAMTGEISLRGMVMPIGGLKEKLLAALRGGIKTVLIPEKNKKDLEEIPDNAKKELTIIPVNTVDEVLEYALTRPLTPLSWEEMEAGDIRTTHTITGEITEKLDELVKH